MIGQSIGHYKILEKLGAGGMGEVYLAEDTKLKREVALKILPPELAGSQERLERFQREAETLAALDHPNIVTIYSVEEDNGVHFLTMQLVEGKRLSELIPTRGMPLERIFEIAIQLVEALAIAHEKGVVHRDMKPSNVMVTDDGRVKVLDFGLAKLRYGEADAGATELSTEPLTEQGRVLGTVPYMSPEQVEGKPLDPRSDLFSLGVTLYEMAAGTRPFRGDSSASVISAILRDTPEEVPVLRNDLPHHLGRIIRRCLEKDPERRYQRARDVRHELQDLAAEVDAPTRPVGGGQEAPARRPTRLRRTLGALVAIALAVGAGGLILKRGLEEPSLSDTQRPAESIAVLPLANLMNDPAQEYFVAGMHDAVITNLSKISALKVISRNSTIRYRDSEKTISEIADELGADVVLEGSVLLADGRVRITAQLIDGTTDRNLWAESFDRDLTEVLALQSEVATAIARQVSVTVTPEERELLAGSRPVDPEAYDLYLQGLSLYRELTQEALQRSLELFREAAALDPGFALAHAAEGQALLRLGRPMGDLPAEETIPLARQAAERALELDPGLAEAYAVLAVCSEMGWDWKAAQDFYETAIRLDPSSVYSRRTYGQFLAIMGRAEEAIAEVRLAVELEPTSAENWMGLGVQYLDLGRYEEAIPYLERALSVDPDSHPALWGLGRTLAKMGRHEEGIDYLERAVWQSGRQEAFVAFLGMAYAETGQVEKANEILRELSDSSEMEPYIAALAAALGLQDVALERLESAYQAHNFLLPYMIQLPEFEGLHGDARFVDLIARIGL